MAPLAALIQASPSLTSTSLTPASLSPASLASTSIFGLPGAYPGSSSRHLLASVW